MNSINTPFGIMSRSEKKEKKLEALNNTLNSPESNDDIQQIIDLVNKAVVSTVPDCTVENLKDLKDFLYQAIPAWQNAMLNQNVFQQQFFKFPNHK